MKQAEQVVRHITSNSGHVAETARSDVSDDVVELLKPLVIEEGGRVPAMPGWYVEIWRQIEAGQALPGSAVFQVAAGPADTPAGKMPWVLAVACWRVERSAAAWALANEQAAMVTRFSMANRLPDEPPTVPWLVVTTTPFLMTLEPAQVGMLGDFERCLFWAMVEAEQEA